MEMQASRDAARVNYAQACFQPLHAYGKGKETTVRNANAVGDNINAIRFDLGLSQDQLAKRVGVRQTTVSSWECGTSPPSKPNIKRMMKEFGLTYDELVSKKDGYAAKAFNKRLSRSKTLRPLPEDAASAPMLGHIAAGEPSEMVENTESFFIPRQLLQEHPRAFYLAVRGNSMNRTLPDGCLALIDPDERDVNESDAFAVQIGDGEATIKRIRKTHGGIELVPDSTDPSYVPLIFVNGKSAQSVVVLGKVVWMTAPFGYHA